MTVLSFNKVIFPGGHLGSKIMTIQTTVSLTHEDLIRKVNFKWEVTLVWSIKFKLTGIIVLDFFLNTKKLIYLADHLGSRKLFILTVIPRYPMRLQINLHSD